MKVGPKPRPFESFLAARASGCIEWTGVTVRSNASDAHRYGRFTRDGKKHLAHRVAYERAKGAIPPGMRVLHHCDNPLCCNVDHLFIGTQRDNVHDAMKKGRWRLRECRPHNPARGERSGKAKLTDVQVAQIRTRRAAGESASALAREFLVHNSHISRVVRGLRRI